MADAPDKKRELALRGDVRIKFLKGAGQLEEPGPVVAPVEVGGQVLPVHWYLSPDKTGPSDKLAPKKNDDNNQEKIDKIKVSQLKWYVKAPSGDSHHDDWSWHTPPWDSSSGSSGGSSSPPYGSVPSTDTNSTGQSTAAAIAPDPDVQNGGAVNMAPFEMTPTSITNAPTSQAQFGGAPPASPGLSQRFNILKKLPGVNTVGLRNFWKIQGYTDIEMELAIKPSDPIPGGQSVEIDIVIIPITDLAVPQFAYRKAIRIDSTFGTDWTRVQIPFRGFKAGTAFPITWCLERRNDVTPNADQEIWIMATNLRGLR